MLPITTTQFLWLYPVSLQLIITICIILATLKRPKAELTSIYICLRLHSYCTSCREEDLGTRLGVKHCRPQLANLSILTLHYSVLWILQLISGAFEHSVLRIIMGNLWFVRPIDCNVKHHIFQSINFQYTQQGNAQIQLKSTAVLPCTCHAHAAQLTIFTVRTVPLNKQLLVLL